MGSVARDTAEAPGLDPEAGPRITTDDMVRSEASAIGIVGAGRMAGGIARRLAAAGRSLHLYDRDADSAHGLADELSASTHAEIQRAPLEQVLAAPIVILAVRFPSTLEFARAHAGDLAGHVVVDISTPLDETYEHLVLDPSTSGAEELAKAAPAARIVKAFNTNLAVTLPDGNIDGIQLDTFVASDDSEAKAMVIAALDGSGLRALDAGALANSRVLEAMAAFGIELGDRYGLGQAFGFKYLPSRPLMPPAA
jgi:8-hydroxy-5-deazaflavin:NADPH oxidoreductase